MWVVEFCNRQIRLAVPEDRWQAMILLILQAEGVTQAEISVTVVDDTEMHELNRRYLDHDYPTDVLSFVLEDSDGYLSGEIIVSSDTAIERSVEFGWTAEEELTLYVLHGTLHLVGYDDKKSTDRARMREKEAHYLRLLGMRRPESNLDEPN